MRLILASVWFQVCWFIAVLGTDRWQWLMATLVALTVIYSVARQKVRPLILLALTCVGTGIDSLNIYFGILVFATPYVPLWLACLWLIFAWYARQLSAVLLRMNVYFLMTAGGLAGAFSYLAGSKLAAVVLMTPAWLGFSVLILEWMLISVIFIQVFRYEQNLPALVSD